MRTALEAVVSAFGVEGNIDVATEHKQLLGEFSEPSMSQVVTSGVKRADGAGGELFEPLVACYDAFGVADDHVYTLTIERGPWNARFAHARELYAAYFDTGPLGGGAARLDSVLHVPRCAYRWRRLVRERFA